MRTLKVMAEEKTHTSFCDIFYIRDNVKHIGVCKEKAYEFWDNLYKYVYTFYISRYKYHMSSYKHYWHQGIYITENNDQLN